MGELTREQESSGVADDDAGDAGNVDNCDNNDVSSQSMRIMWSSVFYHSKS